MRQIVALLVSVAIASPTPLAHAQEPGLANNLEAALGSYVTLSLQDERTQALVPFSADEFKRRNSIFRPLPIFVESKTSYVLPKGLLYRVVPSLAGLSITVHLGGPDSEPLTGTRLAFSLADNTPDKIRARLIGEIGRQRGFFKALHMIAEQNADAEALASQKHGTEDAWLPVVFIAGLGLLAATLSPSVESGTYKSALLKTAGFALITLALGMNGAPSDRVDRQAAFEMANAQLIERLNALKGKPVEDIERLFEERAQALLKAPIFDPSDPHARHAGLDRAAGLTTAILAASMSALALSFGGKHGRLVGTLEIAGLSLIGASLGWMAARYLEEPSLRAPGDLSIQIDRQMDWLLGEQKR